MAVDRIEFDLSREDMQAAARVSLTQEPALRKTAAANLRGALLLIGIGALLILGAFLFEEFAVWTGLVAGVWSITLGIAAWPTRKKQGTMADTYIQGALSDPAWRMALGWRSVELHPDGLMLEAGYGRSQVSWRAVVRTHLGDDYLTLTLPGPMLIPIPREAFRSDDDFDRFVDEAYRLIEKGGGHVGDSPPEDPDGVVAE